MKNKLTITKNLILIINIIIYFYLVFYERNMYIYHMNYSKCIIYMIITSIFIYLSGVVINDEKNYKRNCNIYIALFMILLFSITFIIYRPRLQIYDWWFGGIYTPFKTIISQFKYGCFSSILKNIVGNMIMLLPLSFLLMIKKTKYNNIFIQTIIILPITISIELLQAFTHTGSFDIDDIILNYLSVVLFIILVTKTKIINKFRKLFYTDFSLSSKTKKILYYSGLIILIIFDISLFII